MGLVATFFFDFLFDNESHVAERKVNIVTKNRPILSFSFNSVAVLKTKFAVLDIKIRNLSSITFDFAARFNTVYSISFNNKLVSLRILKC